MIDSFEYLRNTWKELLPEEPYDAFYQSHLFDHYLRNEKNVSSLFGLYALVALVISSLGLFGLISINVLKKIREIGIRKVLGASTLNIVHLVNKGYLRLMLTSSIPAGILSYYLAKALMDIIHVYHMTVTVYHVFLTFFIIFLTTLLTISTLVRKAALTNPAETLRYE
ncbi:MAG: FtsX-like permease family protein [bacterium]|nr:FtsX-like permease family protein [bacterium]